MSNPKHFKGYGDNFWGLTASDGPNDYSANEPVPWQDIGKMTPTGAISSFPYTPEVFIENTQKFLLQLWQVFMGRGRI